MPSDGRNAFNRGSQHRCRPPAHIGLSQLRRPALACPPCADGEPAVAKTAATDGAGASTRRSYVPGAAKNLWKMCVAVPCRQSSLFTYTRISLCPCWPLRVSLTSRHSGPVPPWKGSAPTSRDLWRQLSDPLRSQLKTAAAIAIEVRCNPLRY